MALELGQTIDGKYRIVRLIGEGGMGAVYEGENVRIRRKVAIKLLHSGIAANAEMVQRFEREAQVAGTVGNDHILEILDLGALPNGDRYMVMEYLEGETLTERIKAKVRLDQSDAVTLVKQMLTGLAAAHAAGIVHRDLKPDNIFVLRSKAGVKDFVKIIDFGISKFTEHGATSRMTRTGALMGTPHYMAPEQATGSTDIDRRTDIYAVGIILYECVTGRVPFQAETFNQLLFEIALAKIIPARQIAPEVDAALDSIIMKASTRDPGQRFQTCAEFLAALENWERTGSAVSIPAEQSIEAIVAATVPRTGSLPSASGIDVTLSSSSSGVKSASVSGIAAVSAPPVPSAPPIQPTLNSWANASQPGVPSPRGAAPPVLAATVIGVLLLVVGGVGAYLFLKPPAERPGPAASAETAAAAIPTVPPAVSAPPEVVPAPPVAPNLAPSSLAAGSAAVSPSAIKTPRPVAVAGHSASPSPDKRLPKPDKPERPEKPIPKKVINFGY